MRPGLGRYLEVAHSSPTGATAMNAELVRLADALLKELAATPMPQTVLAFSDPLLGGSRSPARSIDPPVCDIDWSVEDTGPRVEQSRWSVERYWSPGRGIRVPRSRTATSEHLVWLDGSMSPPEPGKGVVASGPRKGGLKKRATSLDNRRPRRVPLRTRSVSCAGGTLPCTLDIASLLPPSSARVSC